MMSVLHKINPVPFSTPQALPSILGDDRFKVMFENPDYQVDEQSEEFRLLNPIVSKVGQKRKKKLRLLAQQAAAAAQKVTLFFSFCHFSIRCSAFRSWRTITVDINKQYLISLRLSRRMRRKRSTRGAPAPRRRARTTTRAGWRR